MKLLTIPEAAETLGVCEDTFRAIVKEGGIPKANGSLVPKGVALVFMEREMETALDILRRQREAEARIWKHFPALKAEAEALWAKAIQKAMIEGAVFIQDGQIVDPHKPDPETEKAPTDPAQ